MALFGLTVPFKVAAVELMLLADLVAAVGAIALVMKVESAPYVVPTEFTPLAL